MTPQHGIRISYGADPDDHHTYVVYVPIDDGDFPKEFVAAVAQAGGILLKAVAHDIFPKASS